MQWLYEEKKTWSEKQHKNRSVAADKRGKFMVCVWFTMYTTEILISLRICIVNLTTSDTNPYVYQELHLMPLNQWGYPICAYYFNVWLWLLMWKKWFY